MPSRAETWARAAAGALLTLGLAACHGLEGHLRPERAIPELQDLIAAHDRQPRHTVDAIGIDRQLGPVRIALHEVGAGDRDRVLLMVHGVLSDHRTWRFVAGGLAGDYDVWAVDLPGCGSSDTPAAAQLEPGAYSPDWFARLLLDAVRERLATRPGPVKITLVGHSLGGGVLLRMFGNDRLRADYADVLARVDGMVLLAPLHFGFGKADPQFVQLVRLSDIELLFGAATGALRRAVAESIYYGGVDPARVPTEELDHLYEVLMDPQRWHAAQRMLERAAPFDQDGRMVWDRALGLVEDYSHVTVPCLILWGERDETLPAQSGDSMVHLLPRSWVRKIRECKHSLPTEEPRVCIDQIRRFLREDRSLWAEVGILERPPQPGGQTAQEERSLKRTQLDTVSRGHLEPVIDAPSTVTVLRGRDIERSGVRYLSDALRLMPGTEVERVSATESGVAFRGYYDSATAAQGTLGLVDGRQVQNPFLGNVLWDQLALRLEDIEQVEVIRGPGSFLHGPNALHGVVSVKTRAPLDYQASSVSTSTVFGSHRSAELGATVVQRTENTGLKLTAQWDDTGRFSEGIGGAGDDSRDKMFFDLGYEARLGGDPGHVIGFRGGFSEQQFDLLLPSLELIDATRLDNRAHESYGQMDYRRGDPAGDVFEVRAVWSGFDGESRPATYYQPFSVRVDTFDLETRSTWHGRGHVLTAGAGYRMSTFATRDFDVTEGRHDVHQGWLFGQDSIALAADLSLTLGARIDVHSTTDESISPRTALVWEFVDDHYLRLSAGRGFRNPSLRELWFDMPVTGVPGATTPVSVRGNMGLDPERLTSFEVGYTGSWGPVVDLAPGAIPGAGESAHRFEGGVTTFYNQIDDLISFEVAPGDPTIVAPQNGPGEEAFGVELDGRYVFSDWFSSFGNYSWSHRRDRETHARNLVAPTHKANLGLTFSGDRVEAMLWANYFDDTELFLQHLDDYVLLNGSLSYRFDLNVDATGRLFVRVFNLLDDVHREHPEGDDYGLIVSAGLQFNW